MREADLEEVVAQMEDNRRWREENLDVGESYEWKMALAVASLMHPPAIFTPAETRARLLRRWLKDLGYIE